LFLPSLELISSEEAATGPCLEIVLSLSSKLGTLREAAIYACLVIVVAISITFEASEEATTGLCFEIIPSISSSMDIMRMLQLGFALKSFFLFLLI
jgi:hypothetical protein